MKKKEKGEKGNREKGRGRERREKVKNNEKQ